MNRVKTIIIVSVSILVLFLVEMVTSDETICHGVIVDKHYAASHTSHGTGIGTTSSGKTGVVATTNYTPEKFVIMIKHKDGSIRTVEVPSSMYYSKDINQEAQYMLHTGKVTGIEYMVNRVK